MKTERQIRDLLATIHARLKADTYTDSADRDRDNLRAAMLKWVLES